MPLAFGSGGLSQTTVRAAAAMLHLLQQHKARLPGRAFALHSSGAAPLPARPGAPLPASGPMAAAAVLGVLKGESISFCIASPHCHVVGSLTVGLGCLRHTSATGVIHDHATNPAAFEVSVSSCIKDQQFAHSMPTHNADGFDSAAAGLPYELPSLTAAPVDGDPSAPAAPAGQTALLAATGAFSPGR